MRQFILTAFIVTGVWTLDAAVVRHELTVGEKTISPAGKQVTALTINNGIPGPVLRFKVGDPVYVNVADERDPWFEKGKVKTLWEKSEPYIIELLDTKKTEVWVPVDEDEWVKARK